MTLMMAVLAGMLLVAGVAILVAVAAGVLVSDPTPRASTPLWTKAVDNVRGATGRARLTLVAGVLAGIVVTLWTRWPIMLVVVPVAVYGVPLLLSRRRSSCSRRSTAGCAA